jgi:H+-translocating NAD(P) transhydrogenase subunit beta
VENVVNITYLIASVMFIMGMKLMTHPRSAARGNLLSSAAMFVAVAVTLATAQISIGIIVGGIIVGGVIGLIMATRVEMTTMPELVALFNGFGGIATVFVAAATITEYYTPGAVSQFEQGAENNKLAELAMADRMLQFIPLCLSAIVGAVTFSGSLIACFKLLGLSAFKKPTELPAHQALNGLLVIFCLVATGVISYSAGPGEIIFWFLGLAILSLVLGVTLVLPIGGADMPVVVALLNSYSGLAAAFAGFVIKSTVLIIAGSLVGASGLILTAIMCKAMNRSLFNVLFSKIDVSGVTVTADEVYDGKITRTSADEVAMLFEDARKVVIIPGYGMAVAQAQFAVRDLYKELERLDIDVQFAIHPVAGRMPGHMNVLLAEVDIPYEKLKAMEEINQDFEQTDVALVLGANDVVNPDGRENPDSPIAGMPILDVDKARTVVVIKRSLSPGFAGIPNPLFAADNCLMYFSDGKKAALELVTATKEL